MTGTPVWDQEADWEEGRPTDADALSPDWDHTVLEGVAGFDSETDADGDLNTSTDAAFLGTNGIEVTFDNNTLAHGVIAATSVNQTKATLDVRFNRNDVTLADGKIINLAEFVDGGGSNNWYLILQRNGTDYRFATQYRTDGGSVIFNAHHIIQTSGFVHARLVFDRSSGVGNDDGYINLYVDDGGTVSSYSVTGIDNDTKDWDEIHTGMAATNSGTFGGSFYIDEIRVSESVSPVWITEALAGSYGAAFTIEDTTARYVSLTDPASETSITMEAKVDINGLSMVNGDNIAILNAEDGTDPTVWLNLNWDGSNYNWLLAYKNDSGTQTEPAIQTTDAQHTVRVVAQVSSGAGNDDGTIHVYEDGSLIQSITGIDNDTKNFDKIDFGAVFSIASGTSGVFFMDDMKWSDDIVDIVPTGSIAPSGTISLKAIVDGLAGSIAPSGTTSLKALVTLVGSIAPSGTLSTFVQSVIEGVARFATTVTETAHFLKEVTGFARFDKRVDEDTIVE